MKDIVKALVLPVSLAAVLVGVYLWRMLHVWPPGKEGWLEEGIVMLVFWTFCVAILLPVLVWSVSCAWSGLTTSQRIILVAVSVGLMTVTVTVPEVALKRMERIRQKHAGAAVAKQASSNSFNRADNSAHPKIKAKWWTPPKDVDGNVPANIVIHFINLIHEDRYDDAQSLWIVKGEYCHGEPGDFVAYCNKMKHLNVSDIDAMYTGKSGWWHVYFKNKEYYSLLQVNGRWMINRGFDW